MLDDSNGSHNELPAGVVDREVIARCCSLLVPARPKVNAALECVLAIGV